MCYPGHRIPGINIPNFQGLASDLHTEWPRNCLPEGERVEEVASVLLRLSSTFMVLRKKESIMP